MCVQLDVIFHSHSLISYEIARLILHYTLDWIHDLGDETSYY